MGIGNSKKMGRGGVIFAIQERKKKDQGKNLVMVEVQEVKRRKEE